MGERHQDVVLNAFTSDWVVLCIVKLVVAGLGAPDQLGKRVVL